MRPKQGYSGMELFEIPEKLLSLDTAVYLYDPQPQRRFLTDLVRENPS